MRLDELYQEIILDHYRNPRHKGPCPHCGRSVQHDNPLCGDEITLGVEVQEGCIKALPGLLKIRVAGPDPGNGAPTGRRK